MYSLLQILDMDKILKSYEVQISERRWVNMCPYCHKKIERHKVDDYGKPEKYPCEHCGRPILWEPLWELSDIRD